MSSNAGVKPDSFTAHKAAAAVAQHPGKEAFEIAVVLGWTVRHCSKALTGAKKGGLVDLSRIGNKARWYSVAFIAEVRERDRQAMRQRQLEYHRRANENQKMRKIEAEAEDSPDLDDLPVRRIYPANVPLPFRVRAVNSVFALGAA